MAWTELHDTIREHRKTYALAAILGIEQFSAGGLVSFLWAWSITNAQDGDLSAFPASAIARACFWTKKPDILVCALCESGWIDADMHIHDWYEYSGRLIERKKDEKEYKKRRYDLYNDMRVIKEVRARDGNTCRYCGCTVNWADKKGKTGGTYDHVNPNGDNSTDNIVVACRSCNSKKSNRTLDESGLNLHNPTNTRQTNTDNFQINNQEKSVITVPNLTVPNQRSIRGMYVPASADHTPTPRSRFTPPSVDDVQEYCRERNNGVDAQRFVDFYAAKGWVVGKSPMKDWKAAVRTWERGEQATRPGHDEQQEPEQKARQTF